MLMLTPCSEPEKLPLMPQVTVFAVTDTVPPNEMLKPDSVMVQLLNVTVLAVTVAQVSSEVASRSGWLMSRSERMPGMAADPSAAAAIESANSMMAKPLLASACVLNDLVLERL